MCDFNLAYNRINLLIWRKQHFHTKVHATMDKKRLTTELSTRTDHGVERVRMYKSHYLLNAVSVSLAITNLSIFTITLSLTRLFVTRPFFCRFLPLFVFSLSLSLSFFLLFLSNFIALICVRVFE